MFRQPIHRAPGATPIWFEPPSSPTIVPIVCVPWPKSSHGKGESAPQHAAARVDRVVPVVVVVGGRAVPAAVLRLERGVVPLVARVLPGDDDALSGDAQRPDLRRVNLGDVPLDRVGGLRGRGVPLDGSAQPDARVGVDVEDVAARGDSVDQVRARRAPRPRWRPSRRGTPRRATSGTRAAAPGSPPPATAAHPGRRRPSPVAVAPSARSRWRRAGPPARAASRGTPCRRARRSRGPTGRPCA